MKNFLILFLLVVTNTKMKSQGSYSFLDINNVKAEINSSGDLFWDFSLGRFEVPKGSGVGTIFADNLWIGGVDNGNNLKIAAQTYRQTGTDFWPGPLSASGTTDSATMANMDKVWKLNKCDIDAYHSWLINGMVGPNPVDSITEYNYVNWPAANPLGGILAPFFDVNADNVFDPYIGDYPMIKGDQAIFFSYNDRGGAHSETGGASLGVEIQGMAYAFNCSDSALKNTVFVNYKIVNKSSLQWKHTYIGKWTDFDIGYWGDDYVGCDVTRGAYYGYNGDNDDNGGYGIHPGAQGIVFLKGAQADANGLADPADSTANGTGYGDAIVDNEEMGMTHFMTYNNTSQPTNGNPVTATEHYYYLSGFWKTGFPITYGGDGTMGGNVCDYMYPGDSDPTGFGIHGGVPQAPWDEASAGNLPGDRMGLASTGPFTMNPGATQEFEVAYVFGRDYSNSGAAVGVQILKTRIDSIRSKYSNGIMACDCVASSTGILQLEKNTEMFIYPNPSSGTLYLDIEGNTGTQTMDLYNIDSQLMKSQKIMDGHTTIDISNLTNGLYLLKVSDGKKVNTQRFIKQ